MKLSGVWLWIAAVLAFAIALSSFRYLVPGMPGGAPNVLANRYAHSGALALHAGLSATVLILGAMQLFPKFRARWPAWHRRAGTFYVIASLLGGCAALLLAAGTSSGPIGTAGFGLLGLLWIWFTAQAWRFAKARDFVRHRRWMLRSYAMTFAAVTLRIYLPIAIISRLDFGPAYQAISWLCWVPNLIVIELWLCRGARVRTIPPLAASSQTPG
ncbi:MAG TPA: DUF2306 domain-containing protein [Caulobacteraceae bacterium]|jgi:uncharacterized membrane protein